MTPEEYAQLASDLFDAFKGKNFSNQLSSELTRAIVREVAAQRHVDAGYLAKLSLGLK